ncbi:hypothetical protein FPV67DRAFT_426546 [Lyophyllum atratum]|nr:hypothetical protein FPV67DRAFT_426546 [Lyophyllum atratum]
MTISSYTAYPGPLPTYPDTPAPYVVAVLFETFLYGVYLVLFCFCLVVLWRKQRIQWVLLSTATILFMLATADISFTLDLLFHRFFKRGLEYDDFRPKFILYVTSSAITNALLLYRCYLVWGSSRWIVFGPGILLPLTIGCGYTFLGSTSFLAHYSWINVLVAAVFNVIITALSVGRIWWLSRSVPVLLGDALVERHNIAACIMLESGVIYTIYGLLDLIFKETESMSVILNAGFIQVLGIIPTLTIVQVGLGHNMQVMTTAIPMCALSCVPGEARAASVQQHTEADSFDDVILIGRASECQRRRDLNFAPDDS